VCSPGSEEVLTAEKKKSAISGLRRESEACVNLVERGEEGSRRRCVNKLIKGKGLYNQYFDWKKGVLQGRRSGESNSP